MTPPEFNTDLALFYLAFGSFSQLLSMKLPPTFGEQVGAVVHIVLGTVLLGFLFPPEVTTIVAVALFVPLGCRVLGWVLGRIIDRVRVALVWREYAAASRKQAEGSGN